MLYHRAAIGTLALLAAGTVALAQTAPPKPAAAPGPPGGRPGLFWREAWKNPTGVEGTLGQTNVGNPALELKIYGPDPALHAATSPIVFTGKDGDPIAPPRMFSGTCATACAITLRDKAAFADMTPPLTRVRITSKMGGLHKIYLLVKLANGDYYVGSEPQGPSTRDLTVSDVFPADMSWLKIDPQSLLPTGNFLSKIDLAKVDEVGFVDPAAGSGHGAGGSFQLGEIDVYATPVPR